MCIHYLSFIRRAIPRDQIAGLIEEFEAAELAYPEVVRSPETEEIIEEMDYGLAALGMRNNVSSFHDPFARKIRKLCHIALVPFLKEFIDRNDLPYLYFSQAFDRRRKTCVGKSIGANNTSFHRDDLGADPDECLILGGWLNVSENVQHLSIVLGSHNDQEHNNGFYTIKDKGLIKEYAQNKTLVPIQPGDIVVFYQRAVHEIYKEPRDTQRREPIYKYYLGSVLTVNNEALFGDDETERIIRDQATPKLPGGGDVRMYSKMHYMNWRGRLERWSTCYDPKTHDANTGIVKTIMPSLRKMDMLYPEYSEEDKTLMFPNNQWTLTIGDQKHELSF